MPPLPPPPHTHTHTHSGKSKQARQAKHLWQYLVHRDEVLETFIHHLFKSKPQVYVSMKYSASALVKAVFVA